jgi:hypothetical protein
MIAGWPGKIQAAQKVLAYHRDGKTVSRIRYGNEQEDWGADDHACGDCRVIKGEFHVPDCDVEECPTCGGQFISCDCPFDERSSEG